MEDLNSLLLSLQQSNPHLLEQIISSNPRNQANSILHQIGSQKESMQDNIQQMQQLYGSIQERKGSRAALIPKQQLILQHRMQREESTPKKSQGYIAVAFTTTYIFDVYHSKVTDLSTLKSIHIDDMLLETWHEGRYLLCRTIEEPYRKNGIISLVEDETGRITMLTLYNFSKALTESAEACLPLNTILLIKEPYFKGILNGGATVRCDSPSDVIMINYNDENYNKFKISSIQNWSSLCAKADRVHASPCPKTASDWKSRGNDLYKRGHDKDAVRAYSLGIAASQNDGNQHDKDIENICRLNRSASYLRMGRFDDAALDAVSVLGSLPQNIKALFRAATAYYQLRSYNRALKYFEELSTLSPSNKKDLLLCQQRVKEQETGTYDWKSLKAISNASPTKAVE
jgi:tetratricopeptide (TPR) repeat protein